LREKTSVNNFREGEFPVADGQHKASSKTRPYWRPPGPGETVYVLNDLVKEPDASRHVSAVINEQAAKIVSDTVARFAREQAPEIVEKIISETAERIVRDLAPGIVERVIREEIQKLKGESN
jgi:hypothetical protein